MADANYDRLHSEILNLQRRVSDLEKTVYRLGRENYELRKIVIGKEIDEYLANYKPKKKNQDGANRGTGKRQEKP
jgi:hypothetical protein